MQLGSKKTTYNLHLQLGFENPHPTFKMLCVTIVQPGKGEAASGERSEMRASDCYLFHMQMRTFEIILQHK